MRFGNCLKALRTDEYWGAALPGLSGLEGAKLEQFDRAWRDLEVAHRRRAIDGMVELAEEDALLDFGAVFRLCITDPDAEVRAKAAEGLWESPDPPTFTLLLKTLEGDPEAMVRASAASSLGHGVFMIELEELGGRMAWNIKEALLKAHRDDPDPEVRRRALESLSFLSEPPIPNLIDRAYKSEDERLRLSGVFAMGRNGASRWRDIVAKELSSSDPEMRFEAARAAGGLEEEELVWPVARLITDEDPEVRLQAVDALGKIGGDLAERTLEGLAESSDEAMREAAEEALDWLRSTQDPLGYFGVDEDELDEGDEDDVEQEDEDDVEQEDEDKT